MDKRTFIREVSDRLGCDERRAVGITFVVLQELRNRLTPAEVRDVAAQLPRELRRWWQEYDDPERRVAQTHRHEFLGRVRRWSALADDGEAERAVRAVFAVLQRLLGSPTGMEGEAWDIFSQLPSDLKSLWVTSALAPAASAR
jgi:uncharacterized protein (DUF2267 family)